MNYDLRIPVAQLKAAAEWAEDSPGIRQLADVELTSIDDELVVGQGDDRVVFNPAGEPVE